MLMEVRSAFRVCIPSNRCPRPLPRDPGAPILVPLFLERARSYPLIDDHNRPGGVYRPRLGVDSMLELGKHRLADGAEGVGSCLTRRIGV